MPKFGDILTTDDVNTGGVVDPYTAVYRRASTVTTGSYFLFESPMEYTNVVLPTPAVGNLKVPLPLVGVWEIVLNYQQNTTQFQVVAGIEVYTTGDSLVREHRLAIGMEGINATVPFFAGMVRMQTQTTNDYVKVKNQVGANFWSNTTTLIVRYLG